VTSAPAAAEHGFDVTAAAEVASRFGLTGPLTRLDGFENLVYAAAEGVLRIGHTSHRTAAEVAAEIDFVGALAAAGVAVAVPRTTVDGRGWVQVPDPRGNGASVAAAFEWASGEIVEDGDEGVDAERLWGDAMFTAWGRTVGAMHAASVAFTRRRGRIAREEWHDYRSLRSLESALEPDLHDAARRHVDRVASSAASDTTYGLTHGDLSPWNLAVAPDGTVTLFDFDNAEYAWFAKDVAVALYYAYFGGPGMTQEGFATRFGLRFLEGYREHHPFDAAAVALLPEFLVLQHIILHGLARMEGKGDEAFFARTRRTILSGASPVPLDLSRLRAP
jgi:Ser/Thr protein kinase RdoA (MazF antagonist)